MLISKVRILVRICMPNLWLAFNESRIENIIGDSSIMI